MRKRLLLLLTLITTILFIFGCSNVPSGSTFSIQFIDVGQGDAALIECDGKYMLIDGGPSTAEDKVYDVLVENNVQHLAILAISHMDADHIGGLPKALTYAQKIDKTISNTDYNDTRTFDKLESRLTANESKITIPREGDTYKLGSATVEVVYVSADKRNDSLVLLITYGDTKYLFTGDIEGAMQSKISDKYKNDKDEAYHVDLMKIPHHGSYTGELYNFLRTFMPDYSIISVGQSYDHPDKETLDLLNNKVLNTKVYRTDYDGDIIVKSDGKTITIETSK